MLLNPQSNCYNVGLLVHPQHSPCPCCRHALVRCWRVKTTLVHQTWVNATQKGIEAHKAGRVQEADLLYTAILKAQPKHHDANHNMGVLAVGVGKVERALPFFKTALASNPIPLEALSHLMEHAHLFHCISANSSRYFHWYT